MTSIAVLVLMAGIQSAEASGDGKGLFASGGSESSTSTRSAKPDAVKATAPDGERQREAKIGIELPALGTSTIVKAGPTPGFLLMN